MKRELKLKEVLGVFQNTYRSIDIRAAIGREKGTRKWTCIFLKIRPTSNTRSEIETLFQAKQNKLAIKPKQNFRLLGEYRGIAELQSIINEIERGTIRIRGISSVTTSHETKNLHDLQIQKYDSPLTKKESDFSGYRHWFVIGSNKNNISTYQAIVNLGLNEEDLGIKFNLISQWFDIASFDGSLNNFVLLLPIYIKREEIHSLKQETVVKYSIHKSLLKHCKYQETKYNNDMSRFPEENLKTLAEKASAGEEMIKLNLPIKSEYISEKSQIEFEIIDRRVGSLFSDNLSYEILKPSAILTNYLRKLIAEATTRFKSYSGDDEFPSQNSAKVNPLETYVYYLFSQLLPCVWIGLFENGIIWRNIFQREGFSHTVDFILFDEGSITVVECTRQFLGGRSILGEFEGGKLTQAKAILERHGHRVNAILVCFEPYANNPLLFSKTIRNFKQVYFMFREDLEEIESNLNTINGIVDILRYSRNYKIH